jgi:hypothetical protein
MPDYKINLEEFGSLRLIDVGAEAAAVEEGLSTGPMHVVTRAREDLR